MLLVEYARHNARSKAARWIQRAASIIHADELGYEKRETDAHGGDKRR